jgi:hypothetical protein
MSRDCSSYRWRIAVIAAMMRRTCDHRPPALRVGRRSRPIETNFFTVMGFTACDDESREPLNELITPVCFKQVITMLNIHIPIRSVRTAVQRYSQLYKSRKNKSESLSQPKDKDSMPADQGIQETEQKERFEIRLNRMIIFFRGIARAGAIGLFVALVLAVMPWFEPDIQPFQMRVIDFIQQYAIPICSALLIWYGLRAAL